MGWFATAAAFSRIVFPLICSYLKHNGPFAVNLMVLVISYALALLLRDQINLLVDGTGAVDATPSRGGPSHWIATIGMGQYWYDIITGDTFQLTVLLSCFIFALCTLSIGSSDYDVDEWSLSSIFDVSDVD